ncbi:MAG: [Fe-Fe] hydrogenase large subunit C-terminal domain-containing protein [Dehalococcoidia bacterium]
MSVVYTIKDKCKECYACVRSCPVKAIRVRERKAEVLRDRCVACGTCINVCHAGAKKYESDIGLAWQLLRENAPVIAVLSTSFPAGFPEVRPRQLVTALKKLGFNEVMEAAFGAELVAREYRRLFDENKKAPMLSSTCPAFVSMIEKFYPQLINNLAPTVSPMIAMGRVIKWKYNPNAKVVFVGPCISKKLEKIDEKLSGVIDAVLTFPELKEMFAAKEIDPASEEESQFSGPKSNLGHLFPISGGLLKVTGIPGDISTTDVVWAEGRRRARWCVDDLAQNRIATRFLDAYFCEGCINGPAIGNELRTTEKRRIVTEHFVNESNPAQAEKDIQEYSGIDLSRKFTNRFSSLEQPREEDVEEVLNQIGKASPEDQLDCGACGYATCRELAVAVSQGLAEVEMCWPYLFRKLKDAQEQLIQAEKLTSLGQMAAAIAHEINNPLAGVLTYTKLLMKKAENDSLTKEMSREYLPKMESEVTRSSRIIRNLLDFARQTEPMLRETDINQTIEKALSLVGHQAQIQNVEVKKELSPDLPKITADFDKLQQVFTNLILNGVQAMPDGGTLTLRSQPTGNGHVRIDIQDTGYGIPKENFRNLFTPFFTTKEKGKGVGLGLAVVHGIIEQHKGKINVQSEEGKGTRFSIYL